MGEDTWNEKRPTGRVDSGAGCEGLPLTLSEDGYGGRGETLRWPAIHITQTLAIRIVRPRPRAESGSKSASKEVADHIDCIDPISQLR